MTKNIDTSKYIPEDIAALGRTCSEGSLSFSFKIG